MPFTIAIYAWRKPGISPAAFKDHYENSHMPLVKSLAKETFPITHARYYVQRAPGDSAGSDSSNAAHPAVALVGKPTDFDYDSFAILTFENEAKFQAFFAVVTQPEAAAQIQADEEQFLDRARMTAASIDQVSVTTG